MANDYYESTLDDDEIEAALEAIDGVIVAANNGKVLYIEDGKIKAKSASELGDVTLESLSVIANGDYTPGAGVDGFDEVHVDVPNSYAAGDEGKVVKNGALVAQTARGSQITQNGTYDTTENNSVTVNVSGGSTLIEKNITQNGTYNASADNADGYSKVVVNVSGGGSGGTNSITVSTAEPTSADGNINDLWVVGLGLDVNELLSQSLTRKYTIKITVCGRDSSYNFTFYGARELDFIFDDGNGNDVLLQDIDGSFTWTGNLSKSTLFDKSLSAYSESNGLPATMTASLTVPAGYELKGFRVAHRNDSWHDYWRSFTLTETFVYNRVEYSRTVLSETNMVYADWNVGAYVDFTNDMVFPSSVKPNPIRYIKLENGWTIIQSLDEYLNYAM